MNDKQIAFLYAISAIVVIAFFFLVYLFANSFLY